MRGPEIRSALERAERFLGLAALVSVVLSAAAIALAARRFVRRHLDACAVMRCMGARQALIVVALFHALSRPGNHRRHRRLRHRLPRAVRAGEHGSAAF
jgi:predicted lysophospholipase L1 biosynthesis ABC-type transport system permease subunit